MTEHLFPNMSVFSKYSLLSKIIALFSLIDQNFRMLYRHEKHTGKLCFMLWYFPSITVSHFAYLRVPEVLNKVIPTVVISNETPTP